AIELLNEKCPDLTQGGAAVLSDDTIAKVSVIGVGMRSHAGVARKMFELLARERINVQMISTSEIKISCLIDERYAELAMRTLHDGFGLHLPLEQRAADI